MNDLLVTSAAPLTESDPASGDAADINDVPIVQLLDASPAQAAVWENKAVAGPEMRPFPSTISTQLGWLENRWAVLGLLLTTGPLGLPALWLSRKFSRSLKVFVTVIFLLVTIAFPLGLIWYWCEVAIAPLLDVFGSSKR